MDIEKLEQDIKHYAELYYNGTPAITDAQFDGLVDQLRKVKPDSQVLKTGWGFEVKGSKVKHKYTHIGSLDKCKTYEEIPDMFKSNGTVYVSPKLDGLSAVAYYKQGKLVKGITRGNGEYGKDITNKLIKIIGSEIQDKLFTGAVRGELIISKSNWEKLRNKYGEDMISPRNYAAGIINRDDINEDLQYIDLVVYKVVGCESHNLNNRQDVLEWLSKNFKRYIPNMQLFIIRNWDSETSIKTFEVFKRLGYELDGLVLTLENIQYNTNNGINYTEVAYKFPSETTTTTVKEVKWTLSRLQRYIPVVEIEPVELSGARIERATGNNAKMIQDLGIDVGAEISICRSGEVIPKILEVLSPVDAQLPTHCPVCNQPLSWNGVDLVCNNKNCPNIKLSDLEQWCETIGETDGLQWTIMNQYLDMYGIHSIEELYLRRGYVEQDLNTRQLSITDLKIKEFFKKLYEDEVSLYKLLMALNIPRLGDKTCKELSKHTVLCQKLFEYAINNSNDPKEFTELHLNLLQIVKDATTDSILNNLDKVMNAKYILIGDAVRVNFSESQSKQTKYIAVTGSLETMKRKDFEKYIEQFGYELTGTLSKCEYLITNNPNSGSSKISQAQKYNIPIITEQEFLKLIH